jgi:hypothetical protein
LHHEKFASLSFTLKKPKIKNPLFVFNPNFSFQLKKPTTNSPLLETPLLDRLHPDRNLQHILHYLCTLVAACNAPRFHRRFALIVLLAEEFKSN